METASAFLRQRLRPVRRRRNGRPCRHGVDGGLFRCTEHDAALSGRENCKVRTGIGDNLMASFRVLVGRALASQRWKGESASSETVFRWLKFNLVGGLGIAGAVRHIARPEERTSFQLSAGNSAGGGSSGHTQLPLARALYVGRPGATVVEEIAAAGCCASI